MLFKMLIAPPSSENLRPVAPKRSCGIHRDFMMTGWLDDDVPVPWKTFTFIIFIGSEMSSFSGVGVPNFWLLNPTFRFLEALGMIVFLDIVGFMFHISWPTWVKVCNDHNPTFWLNINSYWHPIWHTQSRQCLIVGSHFDTSYVASQLFTPHRLHFVGKCVFWPR